MGYTYRVASASFVANSSRQLAEIDKPEDVVTNKDLQPGEKVKVLQEWELEARLIDVAIDEGMSKEGEEESKKVAAKSLLPEVKKAQQDLGAKPIPDDGAPTRFTP